MACKKPIVHTADGACRELIDNAECGVYCKPDSPQEMVRIITELMNNEERRLKMGKSGYDYLIENFHPNDISMRYLDAIKKII